MSESGEKNGQNPSHFTLEVANKMGIHARPAAMIVRIASRFNGEIWITKEDERVNAKSIMGIMMLAAAKGTILKFEASKSEIAELKKDMTALFSSKFQDE
jgi:phosphocarrier protein